MKKPFYKCWWFWVISILVFLLFVCNILLAHIYKNEGSNIFTAVSGWVSGIATAILGLLALWQNKRFSCESKRQALIQEATYFINEEHKAFLHFMDLNKLYFLLKEIYEALSEQDKIKRLDKKRKIIFVEEELLKNIILFQMILSKSLICKDEIVLLDSLLDKFFDDFHKFRNYDETDLSEFKEQFGKKIREFIKSALDLQQSISVKYQQFKLQLLRENKSRMIHKIENDVFEQKKAISTYFEESMRRHENG